MYEGGCSLWLKGKGVGGGSGDVDFRVDSRFAFENVARTRCSLKLFASTRGMLRWGGPRFGWL